MSLSRKIAVALDARAHTDPLPAEVSAETERDRLSLALTALAPMAIEFDRLSFATNVRESWSPEQLKLWGDGLARRLTYLMEPLVVLEVDAEAGEVEIRSMAPTTRNERRAYYEVRLHRAGSLSLTRKAFDESSRRRSSIPCQLTREVLDRLADDLAASVQP